MKRAPLQIEARSTSPKRHGALEVERPDLFVRRKYKNMTSESPYNAHSKPLIKELGLLTIK